MNFLKSIVRVTLFVLVALCTALFATGQERFPVPPVNAQSMFYLQRTSNTNTIVCELNVNKGILNEEDPVHVFWIRYSEDGQKEELNYIQRKFAYGVKSTLISKDKYELHFVSYKKYPMYLFKDNNNKFNVYATINKKQAILKRIFVKINGGSFWSPSIEYVEVAGTDPATGKEVLERFKV